MYLKRKHTKKNKRKTLRKTKGGMIKSAENLTHSAQLLGSHAKRGFQSVGLNMIKPFFKTNKGFSWANQLHGRMNSKELETLENKIELNEKQKSVYSYLIKNSKNFDIILSKLKRSKYKFNILFTLYKNTDLGLPNKRLIIIAEMALLPNMYEELELNNQGPNNNGSKHNGSKHNGPNNNGPNKQGQNNQGQTNQNPPATEIQLLEELELASKNK